MSPQAARLNLPGLARAILPLEPARLSNFTQERVARIAIAIFCFLASTLIFSALFLGEVPIWYVIPGIFYGVGSGFCLEGIQKCHNYSDPAEVERLTQEAQHMSYREIREEFEWKDLLQYNILTAEQVLSKFQLYLGVPSNLTEARSDADELYEHQIIPQDLYKAIHDGNRDEIERLIRVGE